MKPLTNEQSKYLMDHIIQSYKKGQLDTIRLITETLEVIKKSHQEITCEKIEKNHNKRKPENVN